MDHFTPTQVVMVTNAGFDRLDKSPACNARVIDIGPIKLRAIGSQQGPRTLIMSVEMVRVVSLFIAKLNPRKQLHCLRRPSL